MFWLIAIFKDEFNLLAKQDKTVVNIRAMGRLSY